jgi:hypothetical protein
MKKILVMIILLFSITGVWALDVNIIMKDGSVVKGNMLGKTADEIYLQGDNGKSKSVKIADVRQLFDAASGNPIDLSAPQQNPANNNTGAPAVQEVPGTGVYYGNYDGSVLYYYGGFWWRYIGGVWYRADLYAGPWVVIDPAYVPYPIFYIGPRWYWPGFYWGWHGGWYGWRRWR